MPRKQRFKPSRKPKPVISETPETMSAAPISEHDAQTARTPREDASTTAIEDGEHDRT